MDDDLFGADLDDESVAASLNALLAELRTAGGPRRREILKAISDLCWKVGPRAAAAVPALIEWPPEAEREADDEVCYALSNCAPASIAPLLGLLGQGSAPTRERACRALGLIGGDLGDHGVAVADALLRALDDPLDGVRAKAAFALGLVADGRAATVHRLVAAAGSGPAFLRSAALHALGNIGQKQGADRSRDERPAIAAAA